MRTELAVHGFVLAGGKSARMGEDKALLHFGGRPMVEIAVDKLRSFCAAVSIAGNRDDLSGYAPIVHEQRSECGPAAGVEAGLQACTEEWALFVPVDVPLVPGELLRGWARAVSGVGDREASLPTVKVSYLMTPRGRQPAFAMVHRDCVASVSGRLNGGETRLADILGAIEQHFGDGSLWVAQAANFAPAVEVTGVELEYWFSNVNTPEELGELEGRTASYEERS